MKPGMTTEQPGSTAWLHDKRRNALELYEKLPIPPPPTRERSFPAFYPETLPDSKSISGTTSVRSENRSVIALSLEEAVGTHGGDVERWLGRVAQAEKDKFVALNEA